MTGQGSIGQGEHRLDVVLREATQRLTEAGVASPRVDAELLAGHVLRCSRGELVAAALTGTALAPAEADRLERLVEQRVDRVPLQHLTGRAAFRSIELAVGPGVFVPRPESEVTAGAAIAAAAGPAASGEVLVVDLCSGSGAIALAVAVEVPGARVVAVEADPEAHAWAQRNVEALGQGRVELRLGDAVGADRGVLADLAEQVDVVVANPPYIPDGARPLDPEVADHDPAVALYGGGPLGMVVPAAVVRSAAGLLRPGGVLVMEHGDAQGPVTRALAGDGWVEVVTLTDLTGRDRVLSARRRSASGEHPVGADPRQVRDFAP